MTGHGEPTADDWKRLGKAIEDRRFKLNLSQEALVKHGGPSHQIVRNVEKGVPADYRATTFRKFDRALQWRDGTTRKILDGGATAAEINEAVIRDETTSLDRLQSAYEAVRAVGEPAARASAALGGLDANARGETHVGPSPADPGASDLTLAAHLVERLTRRQPTPRIMAAVDALLAAMPDLASRYPPPEMDEQRHG